MKVSLIQENFTKLSIDLFDPGCLRILGSEFRKTYFNQKGGVGVSRDDDFGLFGLFTLKLTFVAKHSQNAIGRL